MNVTFYGATIDVPDHLIHQYTADFKVLKGGRQRDTLIRLRDSILSIIEVVVETPAILNELQNYARFLNALAMRKALELQGLLHDA